MDAINIPELLTRSDHVATPEAGREGPLALSVVTDPDALWGLKPHWDALWQAADGHHAQTERACFHAWHNDRDPSPRRLHVVTGWQGDRLVLLWPLVVHRRHGLWNMVRPLGPDVAEFSAVLTQPGPDAAARAAAAWHFLLQTCRADIVRLPHVKLGSPLHGVLAAGPGEGVRVLEADPDVAPYVCWAGGTRWDAYYAALSASSRKVHNKKRRRLEEEGEVTFAAERDPARRSALAGWLLEQKRHWARKVGKHGPSVTEPAYERFLRNLAGDPGATDCVVFTLAVTGTVIAAQFASMGAAHVDWIIAAFEPAWGHRSPGVVLNEHCLRWALDRGLTVELGPGFEDNKRFWSRGACHDSLSYRIAGTRRGAAIDAVRVGAKRVRDRIARPKAVPAPV